MGMLEVRDLSYSFIDYPRFMDVSILGLPDALNEEIKAIVHSAAGGD